MSNSNVSFGTKIQFTKAMEKALKYRYDRAINKFQTNFEKMNQITKKHNQIFAEIDTFESRTTKHPIKTIVLDNKEVNGAPSDFIKVLSYMFDHKGRTKTVELPFAQDNHMMQALISDPQKFIDRLMKRVAQHGQEEFKKMPKPKS